MQYKFIFHIRKFIYFMCWTSLLITGSAFPNAVTTELLPLPELIKLLQSGGHIIYMRHGPTDHTQKNKNRQALDNCSEQRNLSTEGRRILKQIGSTIKALNIPVGDVSSSPYCRAKDTAQLVFEKFNIEPDLQFSISKDQSDSKYLGQRLYEMMMQTSSTAENTVFVGHSSNLRDGLGIWPKPEGAMVILQKLDNQLIYKGMIKPDIWLKQ
ncbi:MAG: histidine phosphatase family protein [gamma proteobacterium symbiont of Taylorina sp.]|nr:histidine phosphatase family protein [gamma proteobacterium symbiont of Taylorina sp.]